MSRFTEANKTTLKAFRRLPVLVHKNFTLFHAGGKGEDFFDIDRLTCNLKFQKNLITEIVEVVKKFEKQGIQYNKIAFIDKKSGPVGMIVLASSISQELNKEIIILRLWKRLHFNHLKIKGSIEYRYDFPLKKDDKILLIDDVITTTRTQKRAIKLIKDLGGKVTGVICYFSRNEDAEKLLTQENSERKFYTVFSYKELSSLGLIKSQLKDLENFDFLDILRNLMDIGKLENIDVIRNQIDDYLLDFLKKYDIQIKEESKIIILRNLFINTLMHFNQLDI